MEGTQFYRWILDEVSTSAVPYKLHQARRAHWPGFSCSDNQRQGTTSHNYTTPSQPSTDSHGILPGLDLHRHVPIHETIPSCATGCRGASCLSPPGSCVQWSQVSWQWLLAGPQSLIEERVQGEEIHDTALRCVVPHLVGGQ